MVQKCSPRSQINEDTLTKVGHWSLDVVGDLLFTDTSYVPEKAIQKAALVIMLL